MKNFSLIIISCMVLSIIAVYIVALIIYYKNHDEIKYGAQILSAVNKKISHNVKCEYRGIKGEFETFKILHNNLIGFFKIFHDVYLEVGKNKTTQIDFVIVHEVGLIVVETKNWFGKIIGAKNDKNWIQSANKVRNIKHYNPIVQNENHIKNLKKIIGLENLNNYNISEENIYSIIAFGNDSDISDININESNLKIVNLKEISNCLNNIVQSSKSVLEENHIEELNKLLEPMTNVDDMTKINHIVNVERMKIRN